jgi:GntR family transcriptional repressor for pyruvate dehydrogenase complex
VWEPWRRVPQSIDPIDFKSSVRLAADQIRRAIDLGTYLPGERLPPSRELAFQLGISVATLREAVRGLIDGGLVEMRRGPKGGLVVRPQPRKGRRSRISKAALAELEQILELRLPVEAEASRLAAQRRTAADLSRLDRLYEAMSAEIEKPEDGLRAARFIRSDFDFHAAIARAARSPLLAAAVEDTRLRMFATIGGTLLPLTRDAHAGHDKILRAIREQDPDAAAAAARRHIEITRGDAHKAVGSRS